MRSPTRQKYCVPVIATAVGGVPELVENGVHGLLIAPGDTAALASDILTLSRDPALREKLGTALRDRTAKEFSLSAMALREKEICRAVLAPRRELVIAGAYGCGNRGDELMLEKSSARWARRRAGMRGHGALAPAKGNGAPV